MGIGAMITSGDENKRLPDALMDKVAEVRVEQHLDDPASFAILFGEEYGESGPVIQDAPELALGKIITVATESDGELHVLVRGPITKIKSDAKLGGPGSALTIIGGDRRVEMEREEKQACFSGTPTTAMMGILKDYKMVPKVSQMTRIYTPLTETLVQRGSDFEFLRDLAEQNNCCFWVEYSATEIPGPTPRLNVIEKAMIRPSPDRPLGGLASKLGGAGNALGAAADKVGQLVGGGGTVELRVHPSDPEQRTVTGFSVEADGERATEAQVFFMDKGRIDVKDNPASDKQPPISSGGRTAAEVTAGRKILVTGAGDQDDLQNLAESMLTDEGWFVRATCSTSANLLGDIVCPHQIVMVTHMGSTHSGEYQVEDVTHVINASHHMMDINLRRNVLGQPDSLLS